MGLKPSEVIELWPVKIFFIILSVTLFYNFALANGALEKLASHLLYKCRKFPQFLPLAIFRSNHYCWPRCWFYTVLAFMAPITLLLCKNQYEYDYWWDGCKLRRFSWRKFYDIAKWHYFPKLNGKYWHYLANSFSYSSGIFVLTLIIPIAVLGIYTLWNRKVIQL